MFEEVLLESENCYFGFSPICLILIKNVEISMRSRGIFGPDCLAMRLLGQSCPNLRLKQFRLFGQVSLPIPILIPIIFQKKIQKNSSRIFKEAISVEKPFDPAINILTSNRPSKE